MIRARYALFISVFLSLAAMLGACDGQETTGRDPQPPVAIHEGEECHVCGMRIRHFPGPKGELYVRGAKHPYKYCSTRDLFSHLLQPEVKIAAARIYVHDMAATDWEKPGNDAFVDARGALYVIGHSKKGAMGPTLASFTGQADARVFVRRHGGRIVTFNDITLEMLANLAAPEGPPLQGKSHDGRPGRP